MQNLAIAGKRLHELPARRTDMMSMAEFKKIKEMFEKSPEPLDHTKLVFQLKCGNFHNAKKK